MSTKTLKRKALATWVGGLTLIFGLTWAAGAPLAHAVAATLIAALFVVIVVLLALGLRGRK